jgi:hypothetical protein
MSPLLLKSPEPRPGYIMMFDKTAPQDGGVIRNGLKLVGGRTPSEDYNPGYFQLRARFLAAQYNMSIVDFCEGVVVFQADHLKYETMLVYGVARPASIVFADSRDAVNYAMDVEHGHETARNMGF